MEDETLITIEFNATTTGDHYLGWRTYNDPGTPNTYNVITINVTTPGVQTVEIEVDGNLYCAYAGILYEGYIIAACQDQTDSNGDGVPDIAVPWSVLAEQQVDPCKQNLIECIATAIESVSIDSSGTSQGDGTYPLTITEVTPGDEVAAADIDVTVVGSTVTGVIINDPGLYKAAPTLTLPGGPEPYPSFTASLFETCPEIDLTDYVCAQVSNLEAATPTYSLEIGQGSTLCVDEDSLVGLPDGYDVTAAAIENCHCETCNKVTISFPGASTGIGKLSYQRCWDEEDPGDQLKLVTQTIDYNDTLVLDCVIAATVIVDKGTIDASVSLVTEPCT